MGFGVFLVHPTVVSVLLSASVERCFVSRMRYFLWYLSLSWNFIWSDQIRYVRTRWVPRILFSGALLKDSCSLILRKYLQTYRHIACKIISNAVFCPTNLAQKLKNFDNLISVRNQHLFKKTFCVIVFLQ